MKTSYEVCAVGAVIETIDDNIADLCDCSAFAMGQDHLRNEKGDFEIAKRISLLWNLFRGVPNDKIEERIIS